MTDTAENLIYATLAKGNTAQLRDIVKKCSDKSVGEAIYRELIQIAGTLAEKHSLQPVTVNKINCKSK